MDIIRLGSLYFNNTPVNIGSEYGAVSISIRDTIPGKALSWLNVRNLLVADHTICTRISWNQLNALGFIYGKVISIDKGLYLCRSLKVGNDKNVIGEWDEAIAAFNYDDSVLHWSNSYFWGQETSIQLPHQRSVRGCNSAKFWYSHDADSKYPDIGFRPVLEPLARASRLPGFVMNRTLLLYGDTGSVKGILRAVSDYDLFLEPCPDTEVISDCNWCCQQNNGTIIVDRMNAFYLENENLWKTS